MSKLIFSQTSAILESSYIGIRNTDQAVNPLYRSVAFTGDGYMYTHGKKFRLFVVDNQLEGLGFSVQNGTAAFTIDGTTIGSGTVVQSVTGDNIINAVTTNGATSLTHKEYLNLINPTSYGSSTKIPILTIDKYGHITNASESDIDPTKVIAESTQAAGTYYITGVTGNNAQNPTYVSTLYFDGSGNIHASTFYQGGSPLQNIYAPLSHVSVTADNSTSGHVTLSDTYNVNLDENEGTAATPKSVYNALEAAKNYSQALAAAQDAMVFAGTINAIGTITAHNSDLFTGIDGTTKLEDLAYKVGWTFRFMQDGQFKGVDVEIGDMIIAIKNRGSNFDINDWSILQTNINGALTSTQTLSGILYANNSRVVQSLALSSGVLTYNSGTLGFVNKNTLWRDILIGETSIGTNNLTIKEGSNVTLTNNNGEVTINVNASNIIATTQDFKIIKDTTEFNYNPSNGANLNLGSHLSISQDSNNNWILNHATIGNGVATATLGKITVDAYGHVTGITEVTYLPNQYGLKINNHNNINLFEYKGDAEKVIKILQGTDVALNVSDNNGVLEITPSVTHKYRPVQFYNNSANPTVVLANNVDTYLTLVAGNNIHIVNTDSNDNNLPAGTISISADDTWRNVTAYSYRNGTLSNGSIGDSTLNFGNDFLLSSGEIELAWTEIDENGYVTYE